MREQATELLAYHKAGDEIWIVNAYRHARGPLDGYLGVVLVRGCTAVWEVVTLIS